MSWQGDFEMRIPPTPRPDPRPTLPPCGGITENGKVQCAEPLVLEDGRVAGYCGRYVKARHRGREKGTHRGAHRLEWWS